MVAALTRTGKGVGSRRSLIRDGGLQRRSGQKDTGGGRGRGVEGFGGWDFAWRRKSKREGVLGGFVPRERESELGVGGWGPARATRGEGRRVVGRCVRMRSSQRCDCSGSKSCGGCSAGGAGQGTEGEGVGMWARLGVRRHTAKWAWPKLIVFNLDSFKLA
jgi:hypothetical protein